MRPTSYETLAITDSESSDYPCSFRGILPLTVIACTVPKLPISSSVVHRISLSSYPLRIQCCRSQLGEIRPQAGFLPDCLDEEQTGVRETVLLQFWEPLCRSCEQITLVHIFVSKSVI
jgi:hypothetical protein